MSRDKFYQRTTMTSSGFDEMRDKKTTELRGQFAGSFIDVDVAITKCSGRNSVEVRNSEPGEKIYKTGG